MYPEDHAIEAEVRYLTTEEGGRRTGVFSGYRGQFYYGGNDYDGFQYFPDKADDEMVKLGMTVRAVVVFEGRVGDLFGSAPIHTFNFNTKAKNLRGTMPRHNDTTSTPQLTNADQSEFQFTLNQDRFSLSLLFGWLNMQGCASAH